MGLLFHFILSKIVVFKVIGTARARLKPKDRGLEKQGECQHLP